MYFLPQLLRYIKKLNVGNIDTKHCNHNWYRVSIVKLFNHVSEHDHDTFIQQDMKRKRQAMDSGPAYGLLDLISIP